MAVYTWAHMVHSLIIIALAVVPYQLWGHRCQLKITHQELRGEHKDTEGSPEVKRRIRKSQYEMAT